MRHGYFGKKLSRTKNERKRLLVGLARELIKYGSIRTTLVKAKAVQPMVEKLITKAKHADKKSDRAYRQIFQVIGDKGTSQKLLADAQTRFANRTSGFTQIIKLGKRSGDATEAVLFRFVDAEVVTSVVAPSSEKKEKVKTVKPSLPAKVSTRKPVTKKKAKK